MAQYPGGCPFRYYKYEFTSKGEATRFRHKLVKGQKGYCPRLYVAPFLPA